MHRQGKRLVFTPVGGMALVLAFAATAWACTVWRGSMTVRGNASSSGEVTVVGLRVGMTQTVSSGIAKSTSNGGSFLVSTGTAANNNKLPSKDSSGNVKKYYVKFYNSTANAPGYSTHTNWSTDCMAGGPGTLLGSVTLNSDGQIASVQYVGSAVALPVAPGVPVKFDIGSGLRLDVPPGESALCISDPGAAYGNQAPLTIVGGGQTDSLVSDEAFLGRVKYTVLEQFGITSSEVFTSMSYHQDLSSRDFDQAESAVEYCYDSPFPGWDTVSCRKDLTGEGPDVVSIDIWGEFDMPGPGPYFEQHAQYKAWGGSPEPYEVTCELTKGSLPQTWETECRASREKLY